MGAQDGGYTQPVLAIGGDPIWLDMSSQQAACVPKTAASLLHVPRSEVVSGRARVYPGYPALQLGTRDPTLTVGS